MPQHAAIQGDAALADTVRITCVLQADRPGAHERITHVGGPRWRFTQEDAIDHIESGRLQFFVTVGDDAAWLEVAIKDGAKYLKTEHDFDAPDTLLALPACAMD